MLVEYILMVCECEVKAYCGSILDVRCLRIDWCCSPIFLSPD